MGCGAWVRGMSAAVESFNAYVKASNKATRVYVEYKFLNATEAQVAAANKAERDAAQAHLALLAVTP